MQAEHYTPEEIRLWMRERRPMSALIVRAMKAGGRWVPPIGETCYLFLGSPDDWVSIDEDVLPIALFELADPEAYDVIARQAFASELMSIRDHIRDHKSWARYRQARRLAEMAENASARYWNRSGAYLLKGDAAKAKQLDRLSDWHRARAVKLRHYASMPNE